MAGLSFFGWHRVLAAQSIDTMTHPRSQGKGVFTKLANACYGIAKERGIQLLYGFPNPSSYPGFVRKLGWKHIGDVTHWVRPIRPSLYTDASRFKRLSGSIAAKVLPKGRLRGFEMNYDSPSFAALAPLLDHWHSESQKISIDRNADWLAWRYAEVTENDYKWLSAYRSGELRAVAVWGQRISVGRLSG